MEEKIRLQKITRGRGKDKTYYTIRRREHLMRKYNGFGISTRILTYLWNSGYTHIEVIYQEPNHQTTYKTTVLTYLNSDLSHVFIDYKGNEDRQKFVPIRMMEVIGKW